MEVQDKYNKAKTQTKAIITNSTYANNTMLAISAVLVLLVYGGTIAFKSDTFLTVSWWLDIGCRSISMCMLLISMTSIYYERQRQVPSFLASSKVLAGKIYCCNDNQDRGTYDGVMHEVNEFNKQECERIWRQKLRRAIGSLFGNELAELNKSFESFDKLTDEWWEAYFAEKAFSKRRRRKAIKTIRKIRNNDYCVNRLITVDDVIYDTHGGEGAVSPVYKEAADLGKGVVRRAAGIFSFAALLASVFYDTPPDFKGWIYAIVGCAFSIATTLFMAYGLAQKMAVKRKNALHKRLNLLEAAFNYCNLPLTTRALYYSMPEKIKAECGTEGAVE